MRGLIGLAIIGVLACLGMWWVMSEFYKDQGVPVALAMGNPKDGTVEFHAVVAMGMSSTERPRMTLKGGLLWDEWVDEHFDLRDASGERVPLRFRISSGLIPDHKTGGTPEGYVIGRVKSGVQHDFDYIPRRNESQRYRYTFTAADGDVPMKRVTIKPLTK